MKRIKHMQALISIGFLLFITACTNNNQSTKSAAYDSSSAPGTSNAADTSMTNMTTKDTSVAAPRNESATRPMPTKKKGKASIGTLSQAKKIQKATTIKPDENGIYDMTDVRPTYPGGQSALEEYVTNHIEYPQMAIDDNMQGTVNVQFVVNENGKVEDAKVVGSKLGDGLDEEAERIISQMPKWTSGKVKGKAVKTRLTLPITFKIEE